MEQLLTPLTPWFMTWSTVGAIVVGGSIGAIEAYYEHKLRRPAPWGRLCSW
jgi:hypothetical protein